MSPTWVFVIWVLLPTSASPTPVFGSGDSLAACQANLMAQIQGESVMVAAGKCVRHDPWLYFRPPEPVVSAPITPRPLRRAPYVPRQP